MRIGIVLEGGGMRGIYTAGVLQSFLDMHFLADEVVGVSAGASIGISYVAMQSGRGLRTTVDYAGDKRYLSFANYRKTKSFFGMDFIFGDLPDRLDPFDYEAFQKSPCDFYAGATDIRSGETVYFGKEHIVSPNLVLRASCSLPMFSPIVAYQGGEYLDGGLHAPIPLEKALADGCDKLIAVLTRQHGYRKEPQKAHALYARKYRAYPNLVRVLDQRHRIYNAALDTLARMERDGTAIVVAPQQPLPLDRFETKRDRLLQAYRLGAADGQDALAKAQRDWGLVLPDHLPQIARERAACAHMPEQGGPGRRPVTVTVDRPLGSAHPAHPNLLYPVNYGYVAGVLAPDGEEQDAYVLGVAEPVSSFTGEKVAVIHRKNDVEDKWVVAPAGATFTAAEIAAQVAFQERYFDTEIEMLP